MPALVNTGDELFVPKFDSATAGPALTVQWQQNFAQKTASYYMMPLININNGEQILAFIAKEYYDPIASANPNHITKVGVPTDDGFKLKMDNRVQYGQKNAEGDLRFVVYHDKSRNAFQHRFLQTATAGVAKDQLLKFTDKIPKVGDIIGFVASFTSGYIGNALHTF